MKELRKSSLLFLRSFTSEEEDILTSEEQISICKASILYICILI